MGLTDRSANNNLITIENNGPELIKTNYWDTEVAKVGYMFLSINAGCFRLLVPPTRTQWLKEMKTGKTVIVTRGALAEHGGKDALELLFEDHSDTPFIITIGAEQVALMPTDKDQDRPGQKPRWKFAVYTEADNKVYEVPARYRIVNSLPCKKEWGQHKQDSD